MQKESTQTELQNLSYEQKKFEFKSDLIQILKFQKHVWVVLLDRGDHNEEVGVGFIENGGTDNKIWSKKFEYETNFEIWKLQKVYLIDSLDRWNQDENIGVGFI